MGSPVSSPRINPPSRSSISSFWTGFDSTTLATSSSRATQSVTKYADTAFELIVVVQREAFAFATSVREATGPAVPILFASYGGRTSPPMALRDGDMELTFESNFDAILETAKALFPDTRNVALVWESTDLNRVRIQRAGLTTIEVREPSLERFREVLGNLPPHTIAVLGGAGRQDVSGERPVNPAWPLCEVASAASNSPTFMQGAHFLGCGILGGPLRDFDLLGRVLGDRIVSRLDSGEPKSEEIPLAAITRTVFDGRQLERWRVSERALPTGSVVEFRAPNLWRDYGIQVLGALLAIGLQTVLIVGLMLERKRRRVAEAEGRENLMIAARAERQVLAGTLAPLRMNLANRWHRFATTRTPPKAFCGVAMPQLMSSSRSSATFAQPIIVRARCSDGTVTCCDRVRWKSGRWMFAPWRSRASPSSGTKPSRRRLGSIPRSMASHAWSRVTRFCCRKS